MAKKKLREWEIPMNLSNEERILYKMTVEDQIANLKRFGAFLVVLDIVRNFTPELKT